MILCFAGEIACGLPWEHVRYNAAGVKWKNKQKWDGGGDNCVLYTL